MKTLILKIKGKVQGVYYRISTKAVADQLKVRGIVKNVPDGTVYVEAQGEDAMLEELLDFCRQGPEKAVVEGIEVSYEDRKLHKNFDILKK